MAQDDGGGLDWDTYYETRKNFDALRVAQINAFDRAILTISTSAIGFSVVIMSAFATRGPVTALGYLITCWVFFAIAIVINLTSYLLAARSLDVEIADLDAVVEGKSPGDASRNRFVRLTKTANIGAILTFLFGVGALLIFAYMNAQAGTENVKN